MADDAEKEGINASAVDAVTVRDTAATAERRRADGMVVGRLTFVEIGENGSWSVMVDL